MEKSRMRKESPRAGGTRSTKICKNSKVCQILKLLALAGRVQRARGARAHRAARTGHSDSLCAQLRALIWGRDERLICYTHNI